MVGDFKNLHNATVFDSNRNPALRVATTSDPRSGSIDAFGRSRVSLPTTLFDSKFLTGKDDFSWEEDFNGAGSTSVYNSNEVSVDLTVNTDTPRHVIRQSKKYIPYNPGKSQLALITFAMSTAKTNLTQRVGYFDGDNGIYFEQADNIMSMVIRSDTSGGVVEERIPQSNWNLSKLDGSEADEVILDPTNTQILCLDFQWLGVGKVRIGFILGGGVRYVHEFQHANAGLIVPYIATPNLPIRYEIRNTGTTSGSSTLKQICCSVMSEGGALPTGKNFSVNSGTTLTTLADTTRTLMLAIRPKFSFLSKTNRRILQMQTFNVFTSAEVVLYELVHIPAPLIVSATWADVGATESSTEFSTDLELHDPLNEEILIRSEFFGVGTKNVSATTTGAIAFHTPHHELLVNFDGTDSEILAIFVTRVGAIETNVGASIEWIEYT